MTNHEDNSKYLESWSEELTAKADRVRQLIGNRHWLTDGHHKEVIVREFLSRYMPPSLVIGSGFIKSLDEDLCSPEIDILISYPNRHPAFFNEGGIQILPPSSVTAYIEMKSNFTSKSLSKALDAVSSTQLAIGTHAYKIWRSIFFCSIAPNFSSFADTVEKSIYSTFSNTTPSDVEKRVPTCIASFENYIAFIRVDKKQREVIINYFNSKRLSAAITFSDLFEYIRHYFGGAQVGELSYFITNLDSDNEDYLQRKLKIDE